MSADFLLMDQLFLGFRAFNISSLVVIGRQLPLDYWVVIGINDIFISR